jgi:hypothetical protein
VFKGEELARVSFDRPQHKVYLAGKIGKNDWRHDLLPGLRGALSEEDLQLAPFPDEELMLAEHVAYTGPFFISDDHGCSHGPTSHGNGIDGCLVSFVKDESCSRLAVAERCRLGIERSTAVFVWIDDATAFGTLVEIGIAAALNKRVWIYTPEDFDSSEMWFASHIASEGRILHASSPASAVADLLMKLEMNAKPL